MSIPSIERLQRLAEEGDPDALRALVVELRRRNEAKALREVLTRHGKTVADLLLPLPCDEALELVHSVLDALGNLHRSGVAHGRLDRDGVYVGELGSRAFTLLDLGPSQHDPAELAGPPRKQGCDAYLAPEVATSPSREVPLCFDIYRLDDDSSVAMFHHREIGVTRALGNFERRVVLTLDDASYLKIGRSPSSHLELTWPSVSRMHAVIERSSTGELKIIDLGARIGTGVNGVGVNQSLVRSGDCLNIGPYNLVVSCAGPADVRSDVYSVGCLLCELLTGKPWHRCDPATGDLEGLCAPVLSAIEFACTRLPDHRPQTIPALQRALGRTITLDERIASSSSDAPWQHNEE